ncbi:MAG: alpha/beta fold hydrolase [Candidatus Lokiarchaeota archaeon]|nr:alpha/beta fold hydrolase [Candidatus Lokiarchaeota archaeon]
MNNKKKILLITVLSVAILTMIAIPFALAAPTVTTGSASNITNSSATLTASFNVDGEDVTVYFEISGVGTTSGEGYSSSGTHSETITGLASETEYQYRAILQYTTRWWWWTRTYTIYGNWMSFTTEEGTTPPPPPPPGKNPILFVHGYTGSASNWNTMISRFRSAGYEDDLLYAFTFSNPSSASSGINERNAGEISGWVDYILSQTGASEIDIIGHSMGGLSSRWYIKYLGGTSKVDDYVSLGTPQHGTTLSFWGDMRPGSSFLNRLNSGDETPSGVDWTTVRTEDDELVHPIDTAMLDGAENFLIDGPGHMELLTDSQAFNIAFNSVND